MKKPNITACDAAPKKALNKHPAQRPRPKTAWAHKLLIAYLLCQAYYPHPRMNNSAPAINISVEQTKPTDKHAITINLHGQNQAPRRKQGKSLH